MEKYIKAETVLKFINGCLEHEDKITDTEKAVLIGVKTCIERIPATDVKPVVHGKWIFEEYELASWCTKAVCSSCKKTVANNSDLAHDWGQRLFLHDYQFCPKCGADMRIE